MSKKLYVGSLPYQTTNSELEEHFSQIGPVSSATVITDKYSGQGKGFGFVEYESDEDANKAISTLNGTEFQGRTLVVNEARPQEPRSGSGFSRNRGGSRQGGYGKPRRW